MRISSADAYKNARNQEKNKPPEAFWIDDRPYLPTAVVDVANRDGSVQRIASAILKLIQAGRDDEQTSMMVSAAVEEEKDLLLKVERVSGGITNTLYHVSGFTKQRKNGYNMLLPDAVLVRVFGAEGMIDRDEENATYAALAERSIAPPYYGRFANGRVEGWMEGMRPLVHTELSQPAIRQGCAVALAKLHVGFALPEQQQQQSNNGNDEKEPSMWIQLYDWLDQAEKGTFRTEQETESCKQLQLTEKIRPELSWLKEQVAQTVPHTPNVFCFCHNDMLAANILYNDDTQEIQLIDFEYGGKNYRAFDIANHFNEYAGGPPDDAEPDYTLLPTQQQQRDFIRTYLQTASESSCGNGGSSITEVEEVDAMMSEVQCFLLANHLYWGLWGINQAATEGCKEYDYMRYAVNRIQEYHVTKKKQLQQQQSD